MFCEVVPFVRALGTSAIEREDIEGLRWLVFCSGGDLQKSLAPCRVLTGPEGGDLWDAAALPVC
jgi:hypothetical protein